MASKKPHGRKQGRSAISGKFVTKKYADNHPKTTEIEVVPLPKYGLKNRSKKR